MSFEKRLKGSSQRTAQLTITNTVANLADSDSVAVSVPAEVRGFEIYNPNNFSVWLKIFNGAASSITLSSAVPSEVYELKQGAVNYRPVNHPITYMASRMSFAVTREPGAGATSPVQSVVGKIIYGLG